MRTPSRRSIVLAALLAILVAAPTWADAGAPAWIGVSIQALERDRARDLDLGADVRGVVVENVVPDGPAAAAGIAPDDVVTQVDGRSVRDASAFIRAVQRHRPGETLRLTVLRRGGKAQSVDVVLRQRPDGEDDTRRLPLADARVLSLGRGPRLGVEVVDLDADLAAYFDVPPGSGVLVTRVQEGGGAAEAGIKSGDVIQRLAEKPVGSVEELHELLRDFERGDRVEVALRRRGGDRKLEVELAGPGDFAWHDVLPAPRALAFDGDLEALRRDLRELRREMESMQREMRGLRR